MCKHIRAWIITKKEAALWDPRFWAYNNNIIIIILSSKAVSF